MEEWQISDIQHKIKEFISKTDKKIVEVRQSIVNHGWVEKRKQMFRFHYINLSLLYSGTGIYFPPFL